MEGTDVLPRIRAAKFIDSMSQLRANFTSTSARNAGTFTAYSEEFYVKGANPPNCLGFAKVTPVAHTNAGSKIRPSALPSGLAGLVWLGLFSVAIVFGFEPSLT